MRYFLLVNLFALTTLLNGCSIFSSDEPEPAKLVKFKPTVELKSLWTRRLGNQGEEELYLRLTPAIDGDNIFAANVKGKVFAINRFENDKVWKVDVDESLSSAVGAGEGLVLVATKDGVLIALAQQDGSERWRTQLSSEMLAAAQVEKGIVIVQTTDGKLSGLDANSGEIRWTYSTQVPTLTLRTAPTPVLENSVVYASFPNGKVIALNSQTGLLVWQKQVSFPSGRNELERLIDFDGQPLISGNDLYIAGYQGNAAGLDKEQGGIQWMEPVSARGAVVGGIGNLFLTQTDDSVIALKMATGRQFWENTEMKLRNVSAPAVVGDYIVVTDYEGYLHILSQEDGKFVGRFHLWRDTARNAPFSDGEILYLLTDKGKLRAFRLKQK